MADKKCSSRPPEMLVEEMENEQTEVLAEPKVSRRDVAIENLGEDIYTEVMSTIVDSVYGERYRNFEIALFDIDMNAECLAIFQAYVYAMLMNRSFYNIPGARSNRGMAMAIAQAAEYFFKNTGSFGDFILRLDKWHEEMMAERGDVLHQPIKGSDELVNLIDRILLSLEP